MRTTMKITRKYIMQHRTEKGAWTRPQIEALGIDWPPTKGWIDRVIGKELSDDKRKAFEAKVPVKEQRREMRSMGLL